MKYPYLLFDLDGTVIDSGEGVKKSVLYALDRLGFPPIDWDKLDPFLGPPLPYSFHTFAGVPEKDCGKAVEYYREFYRGQGAMFMYSVYAGMPEALKELKAAGYKLALATSKPQPFAEQLMQREGLFDCFSAIVGSDLEEKTRAKKVDVIRACLTELGAAPEEALMIGDRKYDILGAAEAGIASMGITFGYGDRKELEDAKADYICESVSDLLKRLLTDAL